MNFCFWRTLREGVGGNPFFGGDEGAAKKRLGAADRPEVEGERC